MFDRAIANSVLLPIVSILFCFQAYQISADETANQISPPRQPIALVEIDDKLLAVGNRIGTISIVDVKAGLSILEQSICSKQGTYINILITIVVII